VTDFEDAAIGPRALEAVMPAEILGIAAQLGLGIGSGTELAMLREIAHEIAIASWLADKRVGQIEHLLEVPVPRGEA
jgi:hypothetical protein